jgi:4-hydroxy-tetrahydrodipicolinate synthase
MSTAAGSVAGVVPIVATPFDADGRLDEDSLRREVEFLVRAGVDAVTVFGVAGEFYALPDAERGRGVRIAVERAAGRLPLIAGTGHTGTEVAVALSRAAEEAGASAIMLIMPFFIRSDAAGVYAYCAAVVQGDQRADHGAGPAPDHRGDAASAPPGPDGARASRRPPCQDRDAGAGGKIAELVAALEGALTSWAGWPAFTSWRAGSAGTMPAALMPQVYRAVWDAARAGQRERAQRLVTRYFPLIRLTNQPGLGPSLAKALLHWAGVIDTPHVRGPAPTPDGTTLYALREAAETLNLFEIMAGRAAVVDT